MLMIFFVMDVDGNILIFNKFIVFIVGMLFEELFCCNVRDLVEDGVYNDFVILEVICIK